MRIAIIALFLIVFTSCTQYKKIVYLQDEIPTQQDSVFTNYKLRTGDILYVQVYSPDPIVNSLFNLESSNTQRMQNEVGLYLSGFEINEAGNIKLPIIKDLYVEGKTLNQAQKLLTDSISSYVNDVTVKTKLISYRVTVLGEINRPGIINVYRDKATIFDVLGLCGDIGIYGDRTNVEVLRNEGKIKIRYNLDLTNTNVINSKGYYIYPNDIVYVRPLRMKPIRDNIMIYTLTLSSITTFLLILNYFK